MKRLWRLLFRRRPRPAPARVVTIAGPAELLRAAAAAGVRVELRVRKR